METGSTTLVDASQPGTEGHNWRPKSPGDQGWLRTAWLRQRHLLMPLGPAAKVWARMPAQGARENALDRARSDTHGLGLTRCMCEAKVSTNPMHS